MSGQEGAPLPIATPAQTRTAVRALLRSQRWLAVRAFGVLVAATAIGLATPPLLGRIVDVVADGRPPDAVTLPVLLLVAVAVSQGVAMAWGLSLVARLGEWMLARLRERFVDRALHLPLSQVEQAGSGDLAARVGDDVMVIAEAVRDALPELARAVLTIGLTLAALVVLDWRFLLAALLAVPIQLYTVRWYARRAGPVYASQRAAVGAQQHQLLGTVSGAATVRAFRLADDHLGRIGERSRAAVELALRAIRLVTRFYARLNLAEYVGLAAVLAAGFLLVRGGEVSVGTATAAALYFHSLFNPITAALALVDDAQAATASLARLVGVAGQPEPPGDPDLAPAPGSSDTRAVAAPGVHDLAVPPPRAGAAADASVQAAGIHHAYRPGHEVLHGVDLEIHPHQRVALVGASGAGKSTLASLIAGNYQPTAGTIRVGGAPVGALGPAATTRHPPPRWGPSRAVVLVTQEVHVFAGPLADDLRLARPDATDEQLREALVRVEALDWVAALPDGLATVVGHGGHRLTVAQAQQLALARLILADPPVAILDEATAEAGSAGARLLERASGQALAGRSALVVAHRLTQAAAADRIVVLAGGRVVETGTHEELVGAGGHYATLWSAWAGTGREPIVRFA